MVDGVWDGAGFESPPPASFDHIWEASCGPDVRLSALQLAVDSFPELGSVEDSVRIVERARLFEQYLDGG